jgi:integrase
VTTKEGSNGSFLLPFISTNWKGTLHRPLRSVALDIAEQVIRGSRLEGATLRTGDTGIPGKRSCRLLTLWLSRFPGAKPYSYAFPQYSAGLAGNARLALLHSVDLNRPIGAWKKAWKIACQSAGVRYRWHDCRHTFITRLAENPNVSEETIRALAGHVSKRMLERYSHVRLAAKEAAIADLERPASTLTTREPARSPDVSDHSPETPTIARRER